MVKEIIVDKQSSKVNSKEDLHLPFTQTPLESVLSKGRLVKVHGTNVLRVPFGVRQPRKQRPEKPDTRITLVLPFQPQGSPTPPPQAA